MVYPEDPIAGFEDGTASAPALAPVLPRADGGGQRGRRTGGGARGSGASGPGGDPLAIDHPTLAQAVADRLRQLIVEGVLVPGVWLNERDLCERLCVSRTPLREAYRILASEGLVVLLPKRGAQVVALSAQDVGNLFDLLAVMEGLAGRLAAERASDEELARIAALHREAVDAHAVGDLKRYFAASMGTHLAISAAAHNPALSETYRRLNLRVQNLRYRSNVEPAEWSSATATHDSFVSALLARDAGRAESLMRAHALEKKEAAMRDAQARADALDATASKASRNHTAG